MKNKETETKFKSALGVARHLFGRLVCLGAVILTCASAPAQNLFVASDTGNAGGGSVYEFTPNGVRSTFASGLAGALAFDKAGNLFVLDFGGKIHKFTTSGARTTFASGFNWAWPLAFDSAGNLFVAT